MALARRVGSTGVAVIMLSACIFSDLVEPGPDAARAPAGDSGLDTDGAVDMGSANDVGADVPLDFPDGTVAADAGLDSRLPDIDDHVVLAGDWSTRGYIVTGSIQVVRKEGGDPEVRLSDDFTFPLSLPQPTLVLSNRSDIGSAGLEAGDLVLGTLSQDGEQSVRASLEALTFQYAWLYIEQFKLEMARAVLESP